MLLSVIALPNLISLRERALSERRRKRKSQRKRSNSL
jgi:hypothetical protein